MQPLDLREDRRRFLWQEQFLHQFRSYKFDVTGWKALAVIAGAFGVLEVAGTHGVADEETINGGPFGKKISETPCRLF